MRQTNRELDAAASLSKHLNTIQNRQKRCMQESHGRKIYVVVSATSTQPGRRHRPRRQNSVLVANAMASVPGLELHRAWVFCRVRPSWIHVRLLILQE